MRRLARALAMTGAVGALTLLSAPASQAAPSASASTAACVTAKQEASFARGEISLCPQSDGTTRVTGYIEDLLPGNGWGTPDGACAGWWIEMGAKGMIGPMVCPHFDPQHRATKTFDYTFKPEAPVTGAKLNGFRA
ncbi:hypothetical protein [Streptomyces sp. NPDC021096]|uniref:hypothetical protein n=1 Tax=Streptomyces sp. NPDC021096 TaxID=3154792 RepID=UPI0033E3FF7D